MTAVLPTDLRYGTVRWQVVGAAEDSNDAGAEPDSETITGTVTFRPVVDFVKFIGTVVDPQPKTVLPRPYTYNIVGGILKDSSGNPDVRLVACDSPSTSPQEWQYLAEYQLDDGYTFGSFRFKLHDGEVVDLTRQVPEEAADGILYLTGPPGPPGPPGSGAPDATAATKGIVRLTNQLGGTADAPTVPGLAAKAASAAVEGVKVHDGTASGGVRPTGFARVRWVGGAARPTNMAVGDIWEHDV